MPYLIGTDEAGYGPNLGPLTVTGTLWKVPNLTLDLYSALEPIVSSQPLGRSKNADSMLHVADSKAVYGGSRSIESLERGVLATLHSVTGSIPVDDRALLRDAFSKCVEDRVALMAGESSVWSPREAFDLPLKCSAASLQTLGQEFSTACQSAGVQLMNVQCRPMFPATFNRTVDALGNKANLLSSQTMGVIADLLPETGDQDVNICCDKHGGRSKYLPLIHQHLTTQAVTTEIEGRALSRYHWEQAGRRISIQFAAGGEAQLAVALASMFSKYVREIFMEIWNEFWQEHVDDLKPTKGYPVDAKRFMAEIESARVQLGVPASQIWRSR